MRHLTTRGGDTRLRERVERFSISLDFVRTLETGANCGTACSHASLTQAQGSHTWKMKRNIDSNPVALKRKLGEFAVFLRRWRRQGPLHARLFGGPTAGDCKYEIRVGSNQSESQTFCSERPCGACRLARSNLYKKKWTPNQVFSIQ